MATSGHTGRLLVSASANANGFSPVGQDESTLSIPAEIIETPRQGQNHTAKIRGRLNWSTSVNAYVEKTDPAFVILRDAFFGTGKIWVRFITNANSTTHVAETDGLTFGGTTGWEGILENFEVTAAGGSSVQVSASIMGNSAVVAPT